MILDVFVLLKAYFRILNKDDIYGILNLKYKLKEKKYEQL